MEDKIIVGQIKVDNFTQGILSDNHSTGFRVEICKFFGEIQCRDSYVSETGGAIGFQTCRIGNQLALTSLKDFHTYNSKTFGFLHKNNNFWELSATLSKNFYQKLNIQECFPSDIQEIEKIPDDYGQEVFSYFSQEDIKGIMYPENNQENLGNYFYIFVLFFIFLIFIFLKLSQKLRKKIS